MAADQKTVTAGMKAGAARMAGLKPCATSARVGRVLSLALICSAGLQACLVIGGAGLQAGLIAAQAAAPRRIISLVPAATEMLYAIGAGPRVVAVSSYDTYPPEVKQLPNVGALLDPNVERILSLKPDLVVAYSSQADLKRQLGRAEIGIFDYRHAGLADVTATLRDLGGRTGNAAAAGALAQRIEGALDDIRRRTAAAAKPRVLVVFGRERLALRGIYASGGIGFLDDMLRIAGGTNLFADVKQPAVQATTEQILARRPDVILEIRAANSAFPTGDRAAETKVWQALASVPAVKNGRVLFLFDDRIVIPGPRVAEGTLVLAKALHPDTFQ
jgi:iron complex transport system substrate-binding protein